ncbi:MAG TPA: adenosylcobinamide-GDP ribazoletransferase [Bryobacteraceae bacterium]|jgi:adenosylcobinamide-GDP ribazoletransferase|nr:adenosylcobinamide-GDP ribazoletransferase [Bryobacteraceae bacterium]
MRTFLAAVSFLTIVPVGGRDVAPGRAAIFFPLVGAMLGAAGAGLFIAASFVLPVSIAALITVAFWTVISGVLHEDGLADVADAMRAGRTREKMLAILKDSRIGTYGGVAIVLSLVARWQALEHVPATRILMVAIVAQAVPRAAIVVLAWLSRPSGDGLGYAFSSSLTTTGAVIALAQGVVASMLLGWRAGVLIVAAAYVIVRGARSYFYKRIGGVNGDCLGATEQLLEIFILILFASPLIYEP